MSEKSISAARELLAERFGESARDAFIADPHVQTAAGGGAIVHFQQYHAGIPIFAGNVAVHLGDGEVLGHFVDAHHRDCVPTISAAEATEAALKHFHARTDRSMCQVAHRSHSAIRPASIVSSFPLPSRPTVLAIPHMKASPLAHLEFFEARLVWVVRLPLRIHTYLVLVAAAGGEAGAVVFCTQWSSGARCSGTVFGFDDTKAIYAFPPSNLYPAPLLALPAAAFLGDWIDVDSTIGNNVATHFGNPQTLVRAAGGVFSPTLNARDQTLVNAFFFCNYLHDFFLLLGFGEAEGNFQLKNAPSVPGGGDRLIVKVFDTKQKILGKIEAHVDGEPPELKLHNAPNGLPVALHCDVIIHEYAHGVSHRMVGGRRGAATLAHQQSLALDEAWSDYFAITLRNHFLANPNYTFAGWAGFTKPTRTAPYDPQYPSDFSHLGDSTHTDPHGAGEIFAVALIRFNEKLGVALNDITRGNCIGWRVVVESLRQCKPANPTLLDGRDALFRAIDELAKQQISVADAASARAAARAAFAQYGMGPNARGPASGQMGGTTPDFNVGGDQ